MNKAYRLTRDELDAARIKIGQLVIERNEWRELVGRIRLLMSLHTDDQSKDFVKEIDGQIKDIRTRTKKRKT